MNDDPFFEPYPFDFDFLESFPLDDFDVSNFLGLPNPLEWFHDLFGGMGELPEKIGQAFAGLWENTWSGIGGGLRWVWDRVDDAIDWSWRQLIKVRESIFQWGDWWFNWLWSRGSWAAFGITGGITGGFRWVWGKVTDARDVVLDGVDFTRSWLWERASWPAAGITGGIAGGFRWAWGKVTDARDVVLDGVDFTRSWLWERGADSLGRFTGGISGGLGWVVENVGDAADGVKGFTGDLLGGLVDKLGDIFLPIFAGLGAGIAGAIKWPFETAFAPFKDTFAHKLAIPGKMVRGEYGSVRELVDDISDPPIIDNIVMAFGWGIVGIASLLFALLPALQPVNAKLVQDANVDFRPRLLTEGEVLDAELREIPVSQGYDVHLQRWGYPDVDIAALKALRQRIPGSGDLVRFAVREAFDRSKAEDLGFITPLPGDFALWMGRQGYSTEWSERYWWAHWDLPSVTQGFEMLHRDVITETDLEGLLIALDIPPKWIPRLLDISYSPITRVDLRRLWQKGFIDEARLERGYRELGYDAENARALTDWTKEAYPRAGEGPPEDLRALTLSVIKQAYVRRIIDRGETLDRLLDLEYTEEDAELTVCIWDFDLAWNPSLRFEVPFKDLSRATITDAYRRGVFDFNRAAVELVEAGYTQDDAELLLQLEDLKLQSELTDLEIDLILQQAKAQDISLAEAESRLLGLGLEPARVTFLIRREELRRMTKTRTLTVSQISRAFSAGIFSEGVFLEKVEALGYTADDAAVLLGLEGREEQAKRQLSRSEVERLLRRQEISRDDALARLVAMDYLPEDAELIVGSVERQLERGLVERLLEQALLTRAEALARLVKVGFASADAELIVKSVEQKMAEAAAEPEPEETPARELSRTLVEKFFREGLLDREQALDRLVRAGFTPGDAQLIILSVERKLAEEALEA